MVTEHEWVYQLKCGWGRMERQYSRCGCQVCERNGSSVVEIEHFGLLGGSRKGWSLGMNESTN